MERVVRLGVLNIVTQPHSPETYQALLLKVKNRKRAARIRGDRFGLLTAMAKSSQPRKADAFIDGFIGTFTQIDEKSDWINLNTGKRAETDDLNEVKIPKDLRPNALFHRFRFLSGRSQTNF